MNIFQERAFWDVYRPPPGQLSTTELDIKKMLVNLNISLSIDHIPAKICLLSL